VVNGEERLPEVLPFLTSHSLKKNSRFIVSVGPALRKKLPLFGERLVTVLTVDINWLKVTACRSVFRETEAQKFSTELVAALVPCPPPVFHGDLR
jgi:hypothetical protein